MTHATVTPVRPADYPAATPQGWAHSREFGVDAATGRLHILRLIVRDGVSWLVVSNDAATEGDEWLAYADETHVLATGEVARYAEDLPTLLETLQRAAA